MAKQEKGQEGVKPKGWHSRRHKTNEAQMRARENYASRRIGRPKQQWDAQTNSWIKSDG